MKLFLTLTKVDVAKRQVWGRATQEVPDKSGEIFDYESSVPHFKEWSADFEKATAILGEEGKSLGNIRAMHGKVAAGKVIAIDFNDAEKAIDIGTEITDDAEWAKVQKGTYTGFSIGGSYAKQWKDAADPALTRFTAKPAEISIVDNPCVPTATFSMVKADGAVEDVPFQPSEPGEASSEAADVTPPAETPAEDSVPAPVAEAVAAPATPAQDESAAELPADGAEKVAKGLGAVATLADLLTQIKWLAQDTSWETAYEGDSSTLPAQLRTWLADGTTLLVQMVQEEAAEAVAEVDAALRADPGLALSAPAELTKRADDAIAKVAELTTERDALKKRVDELLAQPAAPKGVTKVVEKRDDTGGDLANDLDLIDPNKSDFSLQVMKAAQRRPVAIGPR